MIKHAYHNSPFYHDRFNAAGIKPDDIKTVDDLRKVPFTTKDDLREYGLSSFVVKGVDLNKCHVAHTSGSTGMPVKVVYDRQADDFSKAVNLRSHIENGLKINSRWAVFRDTSSTPRARLFQKAGIFTPRWISVFDDIEKQVALLKEFRPQVIGGYTSSIKILANYVKEHDVKEIAPKVVIGTSELLDPETRDYINSVFNLEMIDHYGCVELNRTAWECKEHAGYHIDADSIVMEFVRGGENVSGGERGEITYTGLYNFAMPLIRYQIGDIGVPDNEVCPCGRGLPMMKVLEGRTDSFVVVPGDRIFSARIWGLILKKIPGVSQFKVIQEKRDFIRILIVKDDNYTDATPGQISVDVSAIIGPDVELAIEPVESIPAEKSGKVRAVVSNLKLKW